MFTIIKTLLFLDANKNEDPLKKIGKGENFKFKSGEGIYFGYTFIYTFRRLWS